jgi:hypothetical protein
MTYTPYASNTFTNVGANTTLFTITWTYVYNPYYIDTAAVKATVNGADWTVSSVSGSTITLATGIPANATVIIYRSTDITDNVVNFTAGSTLKSEDLNSDFDQLLFSAQEAKDTEASLQTQVDGIVSSIADLIVYLPLADVAALNTTAGGLTPTDVGKAYEVQNSTNINTAASPVVNNLPTGVVWDSGILTRVQWSGTAWNYKVYLAANPDTRYANIAGDTFTGDVNIPATTASTPSTAVVTKAFIEATYVDVAGDTMTGNLLVPTTTGSTPSTAVVTKQYVDNAIAGETNTTYTYASSDTSGGVNLTLTGSDSTTNSIKLQGTSNLGVTQAGNVVTLDVGGNPFVENTRTVTANYTITAGRGATSVGPLSFNSGVTVTVPSTSKLIIL